MRFTTPSLLIADFARLSIEANVAIHEVTKLQTAELQAQVQRNASGRPGPNAPTGDYRRSINRRVERRSNESIGQVGVSRPQAKRLEFGFTGVDAIGRSYNQPAYPHFGPALDKIGPQYKTAIETAVKAVQR